MEILLHLWTQLCILIINIQIKLEKQKLNIPPLIFVFPSVKLNNFVSFPPVYLKEFSSCNLIAGNTIQGTAFLGINTRERFPVIDAVAVISKNNPNFHGPEGA